MDGQLESLQIANLGFHALPHLGVEAIVEPAQLDPLLCREIRSAGNCEDLSQSTTLTSSFSEAKRKQRARYSYI